MITKEHHNNRDNEREHDLLETQKEILHYKGVCIIDDTVTKLAYDIDHSNKDVFTPHE